MWCLAAVFLCFVHAVAVCICITSAHGLTSVLEVSSGHMMPYDTVSGLLARL